MSEYRANPTLNDRVGQQRHAPPAEALLKCPRSGCAAVLFTSNAGYRVCPRCACSVCPACAVVDDILHNNCDCSEYQQRRREPQEYREMLEQVDSWVRASWDISLPDITRVDVNPGLLRRNCPAYARYKQGLLLYPLEAARAHFAWHVTAEGNIPAICHDGFDPAKRRGQALGEYLYGNAAMSLGFCGSVEKRMLVVRVLPGPHYSLVSGYASVVSNPTDRSALFCMPVAVVSFGPTTPVAWYETTSTTTTTTHPLSTPAPVLANVPPQAPVSAVVPAHAAPLSARASAPRPAHVPPQPTGVPARAPMSVHTPAPTPTPAPVPAPTRTPPRPPISAPLGPVPNTRWTAPFRWLWMDDLKVKQAQPFEPYGENVSALLERAYDDWKASVGPAELVTPPISRYNSGVPQIYRIDFKAMQQSNCSTGKLRAIQRVAVPAATPTAAAQWYFKGAAGWERFDARVGQAIHRAFLSYQAGTGRHSVRYNPAGRLETYVADFTTGKQRNLLTGMERDIRHV